MLFNILKKDLKRKKIMNFIIFMFITLCTVFLASSVSNLLVTMDALDYFAEQSKVSDFFIFAGFDELTDWLEEQENVIDFEMNQLINLSDETVLIGDTGYEIEGQIMLSTLQPEMVIPLDFYNQPVEQLENGEIAITFREARQNNIALGDILYIEIGEETYAFEVVQLIKDIMFFPRMFITQEDFDRIIDENTPDEENEADEVYLVNGENETYEAYITGEENEINEEYFANEENEVSTLRTHYTYSINVDDLGEFTNALNREMFISLGTRLTADQFTAGFMIELIMMIVLVLIGMCLIVISFVVLRFAIVFTLQEDYKEIGIMKAIGLKDRNIKRVYLIKYFFLAIFGTALGFFLSFPFGEQLVRNVQENIAFPDANAMIEVRLVSTVVIIVLIMFFCYMSARKLSKFTAMQAIRSGETGERFNKKTLMHLHRRKFMPTVIYLALNDVLSQVKSYLILLVVFTLGFLLAVIPLNASNTLNSEKLAVLANLSITDVYFDEVDFERGIVVGRTVEDLQDELDTMEELYRDNEIEIEIQAQIIFTGLIYTDLIYDGMFINHITQNVGLHIEEEFQVLRGAAPELSNEIAVTELVLEQLDAEIGDEVSLAIDGESHEFLITGTYQSLAEFGIGVRLSEQVVLHEDARFSVFMVQGNFVDQDDIEQQTRLLETVSEDFTIIALNDFLGRVMLDISIIDTVGQLILVVVLVVNVLIIALMSVSFMMRDLKQIALIKSLGFRKRAIKQWQAFRILFIMLVSLGLGILLVPGANMLARIPFGIMGTPEIELVVDTMQAYVIYPIIFMVVTGITLIITTLSIKKVGLHDLGTTD